MRHVHGPNYVRCGSVTWMVPDRWYTTNAFGSDTNIGLDHTLVWKLFRGVLWMTSSWTREHTELMPPKQGRNCLSSHVVDRKCSVVEWNGRQMETGVPLRHCWKCITNPESCRMLFDFMKWKKHRYTWHTGPGYSGSPRTVCAGPNDTTLSSVISFK